ncbi:pentatricopeptide repeat-containing protein At1g31920-like [Curcuma longa]|uniref:pentatricopeptide repeat-containing protein At1g31920-like n=1 Tax=Curcuma longa TaxID=136217 RepID=UPI003D9E7ED9
MVGGLAAHQLQQCITPLKNPALYASVDRPKEQFLCFSWLHQIKSMDEFRALHAQYIRLGLDRVPRHAGDLLLACSLSEWGSMDYARLIFLGLDDPGVFDFNTMIRGCLKHGHPQDGLLFYLDMLQSNARPDNFTFPFVLKACAFLAAVAEGMQIHGHVAKLGFERDLYAQNSLLNFYGKCGRIELARKLFDEMGSCRSIASWSAMLAAHARTGLWTECLELFATMTCEGVRPEESSMVSALSACKNLGAKLDQGRAIHCSLLRNFTGLNTIVQTSLIDMYINCGSLEGGLAIFQAMPEVDKNTWTYSVVISGLAMHGEGRRALQVFEEMLSAGHEPDDAIYVGVLSACSQAALLDEGLRYLDRMRLEHGIPPNPQHYSCIVDLMARAGKLREAHELIQSAPIAHTESAWRCLLSACKIHGNLNLAECAIGKLKELGACNTGDYIIASSMYAKAQKWSEAAMCRKEMADLGLLQVPGQSKVEVKGKMHSFVSHDRSHPESDEIYEMLHRVEWQLRAEGYVRDTSEVVMDLDDEEKRRAVAVHSQKLAIAFALAKTGQGRAIRIVTNLRMSKDCHAYSALISRIFERDISIRDRNRFHRFRRGLCACGGRW